MSEEESFLREQAVPLGVPEAYYARRSGNALFFCLGVLGVISLLLVGLYIYTDDSGRWPARKYARTIVETEVLREECDDGLQESRLGRSPPISNALCVANGLVPALPPHKTAVLRLLAIGDWGRDGMCCQRDVALRMADATEAWKPEFILNTGDNFYHDGINSPDDPQIASSWSGVYGVLPKLQNMKWTTVAGNHDHRGNIAAQLKLDKLQDTWDLPSLSFFRQYANGQVDISYIDTTPMYYPYNYLQTGFRTDFNNSDQVVQRTLRDLEKQLENSKARWKIVVGHHPLVSTGSHFVGEPENLERMQKHLKNIFEKHKVAAYICGHEHSIEHAVVNDVHYFVTGAGSKVRAITDHIKENRFAIGKQGFMAFAIEKEVLHAYVIDMAGVVLYDTKVPRPT